MKEKIIVTGGCGFIGSHYIKYLLKNNKNAEIWNIDKLTYSGNQDNLKNIEPDNKNYHFVNTDICDEFAMKGLINHIKPDYIVHFAAESHVDRSNQEDFEDEFVNTNIIGTYRLLKILKNNTVRNLKKFVYIGTDEYYGSVTVPSKEDDNPKPSSIYSWSKVCADLIKHPFTTTYDLPIVVTRSSNNYGPNQYPEKMIPLFITNLLNRKKVPLYGDGKNRRDWIYVEDNCKAIDLVRRKGKIGEEYNIASGKTSSNIEITKKIINLCDKKEDMIMKVKDRPGHDKKYAMDISKIKKLGWKPTTKLEDGLKRTVDWYKDNTWWWTRLIK